MARGRFRAFLRHPRRRFSERRKRRQPPPPPPPPASPPQSPQRRKPAEPVRPPTPVSPRECMAREVTEEVDGFLVQYRPGPLPEWTSLLPEGFVTPLGSDDGFPDVEASPGLISLMVRQDLAFRDIEPVVDPVAPGPTP
eukprot:EG_transcript_42515